MRVLILSQYYKPEPIPKPVELAQALSAVGDRVTVITGFPDYPSGILYKGYRLGLVRREVIDGITVFRTFEYPYHGTSAIGRFANYVSFMLSAPIACLFAPRVDVMYVWHPPLTVGVAAWIIARLRGIPFVYDVQDIWPEAAVLAGVLKPGRIVRALSVLERFVYKRADHIISVTEGARANIISKGVAPSKVTAMPHWFDPSIFQGADPGARERVRTAEGWGNKFVVLFAGNLGLVQGLETIVQAAEVLRHDPRALFVFIGDGADKPRLVSLVKELRLEEQVRFVDRQPLDKMPPFIAASDAMIVHLRWSELSNYVIPSKTLACLAGGRPTIMAMHGAAADLVQDAGAGVVVPPENPTAIADAVRALIEMPDGVRAEMGRRGRSYLSTHLAKDVVVPRYRRVLQSFVAAESTREY